MEKEEEENQRWTAEIDMIRAVKISGGSSFSVYRDLRPSQRCAKELVPLVLRLAPQIVKTLMRAERNHRIVNGIFRWRCEDIAQADFLVSECEIEFVCLSEPVEDSALNYGNEKPSECVDILPEVDRYLRDLVELMESILEGGVTRLLMWSVLWIFTPECDRHRPYVVVLGLWVQCIHYEIETQQRAALGSLHV